MENGESDQAPVNNIAEVIATARHSYVKVNCVEATDPTVLHELVANT